jgi:hypothetical protein
MPVHPGALKSPDFVKCPAVLDRHDGKLLKAKLA